MNEELLTIDELAEFLKVPKSWCYHQTRQRGENSIPRIQVGKYIRFRQSEVMAWIEKNQNKNGRVSS